MAKKGRKPETKKQRACEEFMKKFFLLSFIAAAVIAAAVFGAERLTERAFPMKYKTEVGNAARENGIDPLLVYAVIKTESDFVADAVSKAGAEGLMQIMPQTAEWVAWRKGKEHDAEMVFDPQYNINIGCYLLAYLMDYYNDNIDFALAAYNAGKGTVDSWIENPEYFDGNELNIPYNETKNYVAKVKYAYEKYRKLYK